VFRQIGSPFWPEADSGMDVVTLSRSSAKETPSVRYAADILSKSIDNFEGSLVDGWDAQ
jgi:hypothetical protein